MSTEIKIKRGSGTTPALADGELGFNKTNKVLSIGTGSGNFDVCRPIVSMTQAEYNSAAKNEDAIYIIESDDAVVTQSVLSGYVPTTRTVNNQSLSGNINLSASDVGAASASHTHVFKDDITGTVAAGRGGTGRSSLTSGSYLVGNGTSAVTLKTPSAVLTDIGAASYEEGTWTPTDVNSCGITFSSATMLYTKIGRFVHVLLKFKAASSVTSKAVVIGGLPFEPNCTYPSSLGGWTSADGNGKATKTGFCVTDAAQGSYRVRLVTTAFADVKDSDIGASRDVTISLYYQVR